MSKKGQHPTSPEQSSPPKVLYFEGAGLSNADISKPTINNYRIRTAFHLDDGRAVYLEIIGAERTKRSPPCYQWQYTGFVEECHYITDDKPNDDRNTHHVVSLGENGCSGWVTAPPLEYTEASILKFVNSLGASFTAVKVVPNLGGYRVFPQKNPGCGPGGYYYGDQFQFDPEMTARREAVYNKIYQMEMTELAADRADGGKRLTHSLMGGEDYPSFSLWVDEYDPGLLHLLRRFIGYNKFWTIRTDIGTTLDDWMATAAETYLGKYGC